MIIVFKTEALFDQFKAANLPSDVAIGIPAIDANGLRAVCHAFVQSDITLAQTLFSSQIVSGDVRLIADDRLPGDWVATSDI